METLDGSDVPSPGEVAGLLGTMQRTMSRLAQTDMTALTAAEQFEVLAALETVDAMRAAVRGEAGAVFEANGGYDEYGYAGLVSCVQAKLNITRGKARSYKSWAKRARQHPLIIAALKGGLISESLAEQLMSWSEALKDPDLTAKMDDVLLAGALAGLSQADLRGLYEEARGLAAPADEDGPEPPDRRLDLTTTLDGAGILRGELTPECAALLQAGLEAFAKQKAGADDNRGYAVQCHDALVQLLKIALRSGDVPQSNGQDTTATVILPLHELRGMDGASAIEDAWGRQMHAAWRGQLTAAHGANGGGVRPPRLRAARVPVPVPSRDPPGHARPDQHEQLRQPVLLPPPDPDPQARLDDRRQQRRDRHRTQTRRHHRRPRALTSTPGTSRGEAGRGDAGEGRRRRRGATPGRGAARRARQGRTC